MAIIVAGVTTQELGWMVSFLMHAVYLQRLMAYGLLSPNLRPGMFIAVGPLSFTSLAIIGMSRAIPAIYSYYGVTPDADAILHTMALFIAM